MSSGGFKEWIRPYYLRWIYFPLFPRARPRYFEDAWRYPRPQAAERAKDGRQFLFLPMTDWHTRIQRSQHLALSLANLGHPSVYLNPHLGREYPRPWRWGETSAVRELAPRVSELHIHLPREPVFHERMLSASEEQRLENALLATLPGPDRLAVVVSFPVWLPAAMRLRERFDATLIYDCHDLLQGFSGVAPEILAKEAELLKLCDVAVFSSAHLLEQTVAQNPGLEAKSVLIRNGVDSGHFGGARQNSQDGPVIGYAGALEEWFDGDLIESAAREHPEWRFVLIGRVENSNIERLRALPNVELRGEVAYADLPRQMAEFTVGVIPFAVNKLTTAADPIKLYEYFSLGLPVVSTALPEVKRHGDLVYVGGRESFIRQLESAVSERDEQRRQRRMAIAAAESWSERAVSLVGAVDSADRRKRERAAH